MKNIKRIIAVFILSIYSTSFGATVSDNDGSSFITKAEFDALKGSFQAQIDTYNLSIDSKIDTAIASYLKGIKVGNTDKQSTVVAKNANIRMLKSADELVWKFGLIKDNNLSIGLYRGYIKTSESYRDRGACAIGRFYLKTTESGLTNDYDKLYLSNIDKIKKIAKWVGFYKNEQEGIGGFEFSTSSDSPGAWNSTFGTKCWLNHKTTLDAITGTGIDNLTKWAPRCNLALDSSTTNGTSLVGNDVINSTFMFNRYRGVKDITSDVILVPESIIYDRFTDEDNIAINWANDTNFNKTRNTLSHIYDKVVVRLLSQNGSSTQNITSNPLLNSTSGNTAVPFYEGFVNDIIINWNQIYNGSFDFVASKCTSGVTTDSSGVKHLMSTSGLPLVEVSKGQKVEYKLNWTGDASKEYDVWVKIGPFNAVTMDKESGLELDICAERGSDASATIIDRGSNNYLTVKSDDLLTLNNASKDGYVFIKWREKDDASYGGGVLISSGEATKITTS